MVDSEDEEESNEEGKCEKVEELSEWTAAKEWWNKIHERASALIIFQTIEPEGVHVINTKGTWEVIEMAVDSGATETVLPEDNLASIEVKEGLACRRGVNYEVATGVQMPNLGEKKFEAVSEEGAVINITAHICDVNKALLSVAKGVAAGNRVVFEQEGSYIEDCATGEKMWLREEGGMYMLRMWVNTQEKGIF